MKPLTMFPPSMRRSKVAAFFGKRSDSFFRTVCATEGLLLKLDELGATRYGRSWTRTQLQAIDYYIGLPEEFFQVVKSLNEKQ